MQLNVKQAELLRKMHGVNAPDLFIPLRKIRAAHDRRIADIQFYGIMGPQMKILAQKRLTYIL